MHFGQPFQQSKRFLKNVVEVHRTVYIGSESSDTMYIEKMTYRLNSFAHAEMSCNFLLKSFTYRSLFFVVIAIRNRFTESKTFYGKQNVLRKVRCFYRKDNVEEKE